MAESPQLDICRRIAQIRMEVAGPRGKSSFAKSLSLSPSTYDYYETARVPSAEVLVRIADVAGVGLRWLLTGDVERSDDVGADHPVVRRAAALIGDHPNSAAPLAAFLDILAESLKFPTKPPKPVGAAAAVAPPPAGQAESPDEAWMPVLGRSAAGVPHFWARPDESAGVTTLAELVARHAGRSARNVQPALAAMTGGTKHTVQIVTLTAPDDDGVVEFVGAGEIKARYPDAFAVRIDGESMAPDIRHGDLVICSPSIPAADGQVAVVQLEGQIGVTCKIYRRSGPLLHLVPINEQFQPQSFPAEKEVWALRVLAKIRCL